NERIDADQELLALGAANVAAGLMHGFPVSSSGSRTVIGDSLGVGTEPFLAPLLPDRTLIADVRNGITTPQGMRMLRTKLRTTTPSALIASLGTNDGSDPRRFEQRIRRTLALLPQETCVVWSTIIRPQRKGDYRGLNRVLHRLKRKDHRLVVVDWEHAVKDGSVFLPDGLHADEAGYRYRSEMIADALTSGCRARGLG
ncbi:MAG: SulP family inorganic anion transporter, partial [Vicinamibacteria bacterium]